MSGRLMMGCVAVALLTSTVLTGCGGSESDTAAPAAAPSADRTPTTDAEGGPAINPETGKEFKIQRPQARETILPSATLSAVPGTDVLYSAADARTIQGFPIPRGAKVKDPGAIEETWQFDIATTEPDEVLAFYEQVLPQMGYTVRRDVTYTYAYEEIRWDLVFDGKVSGSMVADPVHKTMFVVVNPPGQPAFAGDVAQ